MIQNTRLGPFKNLSYPDVLLTIFVQKWKDFPVLINQNKTKHLPQHPTPQRNRKPIKSTIKKHDSICNDYDIYTGVSLPPSQPTRLLSCVIILVIYR